MRLVKTPVAKLSTPYLSNLRMVVPLGPVEAVSWPPASLSVGVPSLAEAEANVAVGSSLLFVSFALANRGLLTGMPHLRMASRARSRAIALRVYGRWAAKQVTFAKQSASPAKSFAVAAKS